MNLRSWLALLFACGISGAAQAADYRAAAEAINKTIRAEHYHPEELDSDAYRQIEKDTIALGEKATTDEEFLTGFRAIWRKGPFSHVGLQKAKQPAADLIASFDTQLAGDKAVSLAWRGTSAILTVNSMSGADTIEKINAAYGEIVARKAGRLIIDLRANDGGAFAVVPLIGHLIDKPIDAGVFVVRSWYARDPKPPVAADLKSAKPWRGYSVKAFQDDAKTRPLTSYRIDPMPPRFDGPVFVLTSGRSISAAEIAVDALKVTGRAKIVGEKTPGIVLSSKLFDIPGGFHMRLPFADYFSITGGRLEGVGVTPDIAVPADQALETALAL
jgi:hypothetical protein